MIRAGSDPILDLPPAPPDLTIHERRARFQRLKELNRQRRVTAEGRGISQLSLTFRRQTREILCGCVVFTGPTRNGYGLVTFRKKTYLAHRFVYDRLVHPVTDADVIDHLCCCKACVRVAHLELVTFRENARRGNRPLLGAPRCREIHVGDFRAKRTKPRRP